MFLFGVFLSCVVGVSLQLPSCRKDQEVRRENSAKIKVQELSQNRPRPPWCFTGARSKAEVGTTRCLQAPCICLSSARMQSGDATQNCPAVERPARSGGGRASRSAAGRSTAGRFWLSSPDCILALDEKMVPAATAWWRFLLDVVWCIYSIWTSR